MELSQKGGNSVSFGDFACEGLDTRHLGEMKEMQLFVLGPAFGLPSIDAECIAAVAFLQLRCPNSYTIIPTHDQTTRLPHLLHKGKHISGFNKIAAHITTTPQLSPQQTADATALTTFLTSHAQPLLDTILYLSFENYTTTRSAFTKILPWHANYTLPPLLRREARQRTEHLGLAGIDSSTDSDEEHEDISGFSAGKGEKAFEAETKKRASLLLSGRETVRSFLQRPEHSAVFKLQALAEQFFAPMEAMLPGGGEYFLEGTEEAQAVDCLAYGYLSLMLYPPLPRDWLARTLRGKFGGLVGFVERMHKRLGLETDVGAVVALGECKTEGEVEGRRKARGLKLPWAPPATSGVLDVVVSITRDLTSRIPLVGPTNEVILPTSSKPPSFSRRYLPAIILSTATSIGLCGYYAFATGLLVWPHGEEVHIFGKRRLADYGHLGAALAGVSLLGQQARQQQWQPDADLNMGPMRVEVEVEKDDDIRR